MQLLLGKGNGTFEISTNYQIGPETLALVPGDFNNDGGMDIALANLNLGATGDVLLFWNSCGAAPPALGISRLNSVITISWPAPSRAFNLESSPSLGTPQWTIASETPREKDGALRVDILPAAGDRYYRLRKP